MNDWPIIPIGFLCERVTSGGTPSRKISRFYTVDGGHPWVKSAELLDQKISYTEERISDEGLANSSAKYLPAGTVLMAMYGANVGQLGILAINATLNQAICGMVAKDTICDPRFLFYSLKEHRAKLIQQAHGAAQQNISATLIKQFRLPTPALETQRRIVSILGAYDDLIEVNRRRIAVLEKVARGLFDEWFVRFRFPGHEEVSVIDTPDGPLPENWRFAKLNEIAEIAFGFAFKSRAFSTIPKGSRVVRIRDVPDGVTRTWTMEPFNSRYIVVDGDILIGMDGIFHMALWVGGDAALNQRVARLRPLGGYSKGWVYMSVYPHIKYFEATISGTTVAHLGSRHLNSIIVPVADPITQSKVDRFFSAIDDQLINLRLTNQRLASARDLLLPRLISGQLSLVAAERELGEVA